MISAPTLLTAAACAQFHQRPMMLLKEQLRQELPDLPNDASLKKYTHAIEQLRLLDDLPAVEEGKCARTAAKLRAEGNRKYLEKAYDEALWKYNESICHAEQDSEELGMGFANRSIIFFKQNEFEYALWNIELAKANRYPERLMPKLLEREQNCKERLNAGQSKGTVPKKRYDLNVPVNPKIPFLADGISMVQLEDFGRSMIATKSFRTGDVILHEKSILASVDLMLQFQCCNLCSAQESYSLIPCPNCVTVMYCSQECLERDYHLVHRFECPIAEKVQHLRYGFTDLGPKLFFYGLTLFNDDLGEMMRYCNRTKTGGNPLNLDYTQHDQLEEFKELYNLNVAAKPTNEHNLRFFVAIRCLMFLKCPLVKSIVKTRQQKAFMRQCILEFTRAGGYYRWHLTSPIFPVQSLFNHSCDPNVLISILSGHIKLIALRPIHPDEQICYSYGYLWWDSKMAHEPFQTVFTCRCVVCDPRKRTAWRANKGYYTKAAKRALLKMALNMEKPFAGDVAELQMVQDFIETYADTAHPQKDFGSILGLHWHWLYQMLIGEDAALRRAKITVRIAD